MPGGPRQSRVFVVARHCSLAVLGLVLSGCTNAPSLLATRGPQADRIAGLWWFMFGSGTIVYIVVVAILLGAILRPRPAQAHREPRQAGGATFVIVGGAILPAVILVATFLYTLRTLEALAAPSSTPAPAIEVIGHMWWWEVRYPDQGFVTANEIHIPVGEPVEIELTSADVIHSFWVPQLMGKLDLIPGRTNSVWVEAARPGIYQGQCAEFCGVQHAKMLFLVIAEPPDRFAAWLSGQQQPAAQPTTSLAQQGMQAFMRSPCVVCHTIRGTPAHGTDGPDLTHLASRRTIGAGILANNRGNLGGWIANAQALKPGNKMPPIYLTAEDLQAMLAYLESLR